MYRAVLVGTLSVVRAEIIESSGRNHFPHDSTNITSLHTNTQLPIHLEPNLTFIHRKNMQNHPLPTAVPVPPPKAPNAGGAYEYGTAPPLSAYPSFSKPNALNAGQIEQLKSQGFSSGLVDIVSQAKNYFPVRFWIVDNSGSMNKTDGNRLLPTKNNAHVKMEQCTRW